MTKTKAETSRSTETPKPTPHQLKQDIAREWRGHVIQNPDIVDLVEPVAFDGEDERLQKVLKKSALPRAASILRFVGEADTDEKQALATENPEAHESWNTVVGRVLGVDSPDLYKSWKSESSTGAAHEVLLDRTFGEFRAPLKDLSIIGIERDRQEAQEKIFKILWMSGQNGGMTATEHAMLEGWRERISDLAGSDGQKSAVLVDLYDQLRIPFNALDPEKAEEKFNRAIERTDVRVLLEKRKQAEKDGIYHLAGTDELIEDVLPQVGAGRHVLLMGMPGIAKSRISFMLARKSMDFNGKEDHRVLESSIKPDTPVGDIVGRWLLINGQSVFEEKVVLQALDADVPVILEEFNNADHETQSVLQRIMLLKVGEEYIAQQGSAKKIYKRGPNFCIIANANPDTKSTVRFKLDAAMRERFTGGVFETKYPDSEVELGEDPVETREFVRSILVDKNTLTVRPPNSNWTLEDVEKLVKIAHWSQYLASHPGNSLSKASDVESVVPAKAYGSEKPPFSEIVLSPREVEVCLRRAQANPDMTLFDALAQFANAPDLRIHKDERSAFCNMLIQHMVADQEKVKSTFRISL